MNTIKSGSERKPNGDSDFRKCLVCRRSLNREPPDAFSLMFAHNNKKMRNREPQ